MRPALPKTLDTSGWTPSRPSTSTSRGSGRSRRRGWATLDLLVQALERVRGVQPSAAFPGEVQVGRDVLGSVLEELSGGLPASGPPRAAEHRRGLIGLGEDRPHDRRDGALGLLGDRREQGSARAFPRYDVMLLIGPLALIGLAVVPGRPRSRRARAA